MSEIYRAIEIFRADIRQGFAQVDARLEKIEGRFGRRFTDLELKIDAIAVNLKASNETTARGSEN
jgi:hypothetical protein